MLIPSTLLRYRSIIYIQCIYIEGSWNIHNVGLYNLKRTLIELRLKQYVLKYRMETKMVNQQSNQQNQESNPQQQPNQPNQQNNQQQQSNPQKQSNEQPENPQKQQK